MNESRKWARNLLWFSVVILAFMVGVVWTTYSLGKTISDSLLEGAAQTCVINLDSVSNLSEVGSTQILEYCQNPIKHLTPFVQVGGYFIGFGIVLCFMIFIMGSSGIWVRNRYEKHTQINWFG